MVVKIVRNVRNVVDNVDRNVLIIIVRNVVKRVVKIV
jgi:hypothetical protein